MKKVISAWLLLAMVLAIPPVAYAGSTQAFINSETYLRTSYSSDNYLELSVSGSTLTVSGKLLLDGLTDIMVECGTQSPQTISASSGKEFSTRVSLSHSGSVPITIYTKQRGESYYWSYVWERIRVEKTSGGYRIMPSLVLERNLAFARAYVDPDNFRDSSKVPEDVKALSNEIAGGETDNYAKLFLLHKWVAENIYYDYDAYRGDMNTFYDSADILANRRSVCEGYANLLRDLILAQGIPCMEASTYSLGVSSDGGSFAVKADEAATNKSNHAHVEAWVEGHWVIMDATWDSNNKYENGAYKTDAPNGFYYFDITPEALALDHKYIDRANGKLKMRDGAVTGEDTPQTESASPTAQKLTVNGKAQETEIYNINGSNYFKLRDMAALLSGTGSQFSVDFDSARNAIVVNTGAAYAPVGGELGGAKEQAVSAVKSHQSVWIDGKYADLTAYNIGGSNFFKLRDLGAALGFDVDYDGATATMLVESR